MGYLALGALAGASGEFLKQSEESRANKYQAIRDKRLQALEQENIEFRAGLEEKAAEKQRGYLSGEAETQRAFDAEQKERDRENRAAIEGGKPITLGRGQEAYDREGNLIAAGPEFTHAPTTASIANDKWRQTSVDLRGEGGKAIGRESRENLYKEWEGQAYITNTDDLGNKIISRDPSIPSWDEWYNARVTDEYRIAPSDPSIQRQNPMELYLFFQSKPEFKHPGGREKAIEMIRQIHKWWNPPDEPKTGKPKDVGPQRGMLSQSAPSEATPAAAPPKTASPPAGSQDGTLLESPREIQSKIDELENMIKRAAPERIPMLRQQVQQYQTLLERAWQQRKASEQAGGYSTMTPSA